MVSGWSSRDNARSRQCSHKGQRPSRVVLGRWHVPVHRASRLGIDVAGSTRWYAPAQAKLAQRTRGEERFAWAEKAAGQGDPEGLFRLGECLWDGNGCEKNDERALALFKQAADLGCADAQSHFGLRAFPIGDWQRFHWFGQAAAQGDRMGLDELANAVVPELVKFEKGGSG